MRIDQRLFFFPTLLDTVPRALDDVAFAFSGSLRWSGGPRFNLLWSADPWPASSARTMYGTVLVLVLYIATAGIVAQASSTSLSRLCPLTSYTFLACCGPAVAASYLSFLRRGGVQSDSGMELRPEIMDGISPADPKRGSSEVYRTVGS
jgi:hypothetical protein